MKTRGESRQGLTSPAALPDLRASSVEERLKTEADPELAIFQQRFFRTQPGGYGQGDLFLGIRVPVLRRIAREFRGLPLIQCDALLSMAHHEARLLALLILVDAYERGDPAMQEAIYRLYLSRTDAVNGWDLVDSSAASIVGRHLFDRDRSVLLELAHSPSLWERRIAIISTHFFIRKGQFGDTLRIADILLEDSHDLIHKAVGWMLREVGKRDHGVEEEFLRARYHRMPRTMLRYAIEKFPEDLRLAYLRGMI